MVRRPNGSAAARSAGVDVRAEVAAPGQVTPGQVTPGQVTPARPRPRAGVLESLGTWSARHPLAVLAFWALLLVLAVLSARQFTGHLSLQNNAVDHADSATARRLIHDAFPSAVAETDFVVLHSTALTADDADFRALVGQVVDRYRTRPEVSQVSSPYAQPTTLISGDRHTALIPVGLNGESKDLQNAAEPLQGVAEGLRTDRVEVYFTGYSPLAAATIKRANRDLERAESIGLPAAALVLIVAFGSIVAAAIPLALGITAILTAFGLLGVLALFLQFNSITQSAVTMLAIALGIDYSLFILTRFREQLAGVDARDRDARATAVGQALATAGRAVLFSGSTVMISLAGLFLVRSAGVRTMAVGLMAGVLAMMALSVTLLPAVLGLLGARVNRLALPWARRSLAHPDPEHSRWARIVNAVMRHPVPVAIAVAVMLGVLAAPALGLRYGVDTGAGAVTDTPAGRGFTAISTSFAPGVIAPVNVIATTRSGALSDAQLDALAAFTAQASGDDRVAVVSSVTSLLDQRLGGHSTAALRAAAAQAPQALGTLVDSAGTTTVVTVYPKFAADSDQTQALVSRLRADAADTLEGAGLTAHLGGSPAQISEIMSENTRATPLVVAAVLAASLVLLLVVFRSLLLPFKAIIMNLLSVGAAFGVVVLVFQEGHGASLLGVDRTGFIQVMLPLLTFAVSFGLSMDYEVFLVSRMREEWDRTGDNAAAVRLGITYTARVITAAALIMVVVFASFLLAGMVEAKQLGFMLALAVLIDATVVRLFLVPAVMRVMGRWCWWLPGRPARNG
jgi:RND superfamily putative drug exporter